MLGPVSVNMLRFARDGERRYFNSKRASVRRYFNKEVQQCGRTRSNKCGVTESL